MNSSLRVLKDYELLSSTKELVQRERSLTLQVVRHLQEIERRKLYANETLRYASLFDYAVRELKYSEAAASRRIQAVRLLNEIPEMAPKIESGSLNLSNVCQAQSLFRDLKKMQPERAMSVEQKVEVLTRLEGKSVREGERMLLAIRPPEAMPKEKERVVSEELTEVRFLVNRELKSRLNEFRALLGTKAKHLNLAELVNEMAKLSCERLSEKKFGKRRVEQARALLKIESDTNAQPRTNVELETGTEPKANAESEPRADAKLPPAPKQTNATPDAGVRERKRSRYIPQSLKHAVWQKHAGQCAQCESRHNLQFDHITPHALGGETSADNLQLLCGSCNLRRGIQSFGSHAMRR